jgi:hypothetical protein
MELTVLCTVQLSGAEQNKCHNDTRRARESWPPPKRLQLERVMKDQEETRTPAKRESTTTLDLLRATAVP